MGKTRCGIGVSIILGALVGGCGSVAVRPELDGHLIEGTTPAGAPFAPFLQLGGAGGDLPDGKIIHTPIKVTQVPTDEEFWQFEARVPAMSWYGLPMGRKPYDFFPAGNRAHCEAQQQLVRDARSKDWRAPSPTEDPCRGPHYFKRMGPPAAFSPDGVR